MQRASTFAIDGSHLVGAWPPLRASPKTAGLIGWLHRPHGCALRPLLAQTICCCASDLQRTCAWHGQADAFCPLFLPLVNESPSKDAFFVLFHRLPIGGAQQLPYISRCRLGRQTQHHQRIRNTSLMAKTAAKKAAPKKAVKKVAATKTAKPAKAAAAKSAAPKPIKEALSKTGLVAHIAESTQLAPKDVRAVLASLEATAHASLSKKGVGSFTIPGMLKLTTVHVPAKPKRKGINPFTKEEQMFAAKPATTKLKSRPLKKLKDAAL
ncbi:nucleoid DNA-binding protein [Xanthomonas axonopodis]|nr:nucleoid DNA-binding protein [Xanthomonas euvesicatoria]